MMRGRNEGDWLRTFLRELSKFIVETSELPRMFYDELRQALLSANSEVVRRLADYSERFLAAWMDLSIEGVMAAGLVGESLSLKLQGFEIWLDRFYERKRNEINARAGGWSRAFTTKKVLEWAGIIIRSLSSLIPGAEFVSEALDTIGASMKARHAKAAS